MGSDALCPALAGRYQVVKRARALGVSDKEVNLTEKDAFMEGEKLIAIISDAGEPCNRPLSYQYMHTYMHTGGPPSVDKSVGCPVSWPECSMIRLDGDLAARGPARVEPASAAAHHPGAAVRELAAHPAAGPLAPLQPDQRPALHDHGQLAPARPSRIVAALAALW
jgi:hypothetical protein